MPSRCEGGAARWRRIPEAGLWGSLRRNTGRGGSSCRDTGLSGGIQGQEPSGASPGRDRNRKLKLSGTPKAVSLPLPTPSFPVSSASVSLVSLYLCGSVSVSGLPSLLSAHLLHHLFMFLFFASVCVCGGGANGAMSQHCLNSTGQTTNSFSCKTGSNGLTESKHKGHSCGFWKRGQL